MRRSAKIPQAKENIPDDEPPAKRKLVSLKVQDIHFSQASVAATFTSGGTISDLTQQLINSEISPENIPPIRVVQYEEQWITLDNRRLRAFKDSFLEYINVFICNLEDHDIKREFDSKRTNKSLRQGGELREAAAAPEYFQQGTYIFTKKVLNWTFEQLAATLPRLPREPLPIQFSSLSEYYNSFLKLILEETRAILQAGVETSEHAHFFDLGLIKINKKPKRPDNPYILTFKRNLKQMIKTTKSNDALLLHGKNRKTGVEFRLIALVINKEEDPEVLCVKTIIEERVANLLDPAEDLEWQFCILGSIVTTMRMYDSCTKQQNLSFETELLNPDKLQSALVPPEEAFSEQEELLLPDLNPSQQTVIKKFLSQPNPIQLVQGPPGTGKTKTIIALLTLLAERRERTLVCAASNKAVQELVQRFTQACPAAPIAYVGVEDKLPPNLQKLVVHTWGKQLLERIAEINESLWKLMPDKVNSKLRDFMAWYREAKNILITTEKQFYGIVEDIKRYHLVEDTSNILEVFDRNLEDCKSFLMKVTYSLESIQLFSQKAHLALTELSQLLTKIEDFFLKFSADTSSEGLEGTLLNEAIIVFATLSVMGRKSCQNMKPAINLVLDEAGQATEAESSIPLSKATRLIMFGDIQQLSPTVISRKAIDLGFDRSMIQRLITGGAPYDI